MSADMDQADLRDIYENLRDKALGLQRIQF